MKDLHNNVKFVRALSPVSVSDNTAQVSQILDTTNYAANELAILTGSIADADVTFTVLIEEGNASNLSDAAAVADEDLLGTEVQAGFRYDSDDSTRKIGYIGSKRYIRATITPANNTGAALLAAVWVQSGARKAPVA
jgi:hypothetical protein